LGQRARAETHAERAPRLADGDLRPHDAAAVLAREGLEMAAGVEHRHRERRQLELAALLERELHDGRRLREREAHETSSLAGVGYARPSRGATGLTHCAPGDYCPATCPAAQTPSAEEVMTTTRRDFLKVTGGVVVGALTPGWAGAQPKA